MLCLLLLIGLTLLGCAVRFGVFAAIGRKMGTVWMAGALIATLMFVTGIFYAISFGLMSPFPKEGLCRVGAHN